MIYLDSSALLKLVIEEAESAALEQWLASRDGDSLISSELARAEVVRAARRIDAEALPAARELVAGLDVVPLTSELIGAAADAGEPMLRTLDAIHLVSAQSVHEELTAFVVYDQRLFAAADSAGLNPQRPGLM